MNKIKIMTVFGTRPEAIKMAPLIKELAKDPEHFSVKNIITAQHREMLDQVLNIFQIKPDYDLDIMEQNQTLSKITTKVILALDEIFIKEKPDLILVHGDTTTTFAAALSAFYHQIAIGHVEAGLRTWDKYSPFPEEMNRQMVDDLTDLYFAPTEKNYNNLVSEHKKKEQIFITGNTGIDALKYTVNDNFASSEFKGLDFSKKIILLTAHRRENQGEKMEKMFEAILSVVKSDSNLQLVYPVHRSPAVQKAAHDVFDHENQVKLINPLDVVHFHNLLKRSFLVLSDSGGIQEEAPALNKPVLVLRDTTERPEAVQTGAIKLVGTDPAVIKKTMIELINHPEEYQQMAEAKNPYGDGEASQRIIEAIKAHFGLITDRPKNFS
ncbi:non-hydrolyzing UDP-N-acetylglucosamine 2-epimerase [Xylocopilactobacillus apicola]|uniref:UDP-N-acetylglucosamine 2-epimerase (non-hydrolyzing) n=1 Tax=Xylocopilactobacillus apicola TaxID=2932184 RepID=A0AAU9DWL8_9LACO|nr:UDP-N-acetylglucosamine 2-epimerase (non-hydrolyzing) [Xylocopilactobacillus apicola]BDR58413.1 UDP-N-acetyl glucosamine 2-epimerase [Xylocopilactobacillus apicola]